MLSGLFVALKSHLPISKSPPNPPKLLQALSSSPTPKAPLRLLSLRLRLLHRSSEDFSSIQHLHLLPDARLGCKQHATLLPWVQKKKTVQKGVEMCGLKSQVFKLSIRKNQGFRLSMKGLDFERFGSPFIPAAMCFPCSTSTNGSQQSNIFGVAVGDRLHQSHSRPW